MPRLFGTDGVRGLANGELTVELALGLAQAAAVVLGKGRVADGRRASGRRPIAVIARDPRISGEFLAASVAAGLASSGVDVYDAGVIPTPAAAFLVGDFKADLGVMISASHNPAPDNGIKFFATGGTKLPDEVEDRIEAALGQPKLAPKGGDVGRIRRFADAEDRYIVHLLSTLPNRLDGIHVVLDCAHGAAAGVSPQVFTDAGARVTVIGAEPDGINIIDGDQIMAILAVSMAERGVLAERTLVATVMSNLGLKRAMAANDIRMVETAVGDRYVLEALDERGLSLGGEQSGHVIMTRFATTGDGILTGLHLVAEMARTGKTIAELASVMTVYPQVLVNVRGVDHHALGADTVIADAVAAAEAKLGDSGRVLLRPSGTEPMVRVMVEAEHQDLADEIAAGLAEVVRERLAH
jgi:phosphoglucosamine mutase